MRRFALIAGSLLVAGLLAACTSTTPGTAAAPSGLVVTTTPITAEATVAATPVPAAAPAAPAPPDSGPGCAKRAMAAAKFNPACAEYQGYLDPGRSADRAPTSGDTQHAYGCAQGYIPKSQC